MRSLARKRASRRSMLGIFAALTLPRFSAIRCNTALPARIKPNTKSASVFFWCPWILGNKDLTCSSQSLHNRADASIEIVPPRCSFHFLLVETISFSCALLFFSLWPISVRERGRVRGVPARRSALSPQRTAERHAWPPPVPLEREPALPPPGRR